MRSPVVPRWSRRTTMHAWTKLALARRLWRIDVGPRTVVHPSALLDRTWPRGLHIGADCIIAADAVILTHDFTRGLLTDTHVGDRCAIGARTIVMPGVTIGNDCVVRPGTVVTRDIPAGSTAWGNPVVCEPRADLSGPR